MKLLPVLSLVLYSSCALFAQENVSPDQSLASTQDNLVDNRSAANSDVFMPMVIVDDAGNNADTTGYGAVDNTFSIGRFDVTADQYCVFLNAVATDEDPYGLYDSRMGTDENIKCIARSKGKAPYSYSIIQDKKTDNNRGQFPITYVSLYSAARFCNWLQNGAPSVDPAHQSTETGAYTLNSATSGTLERTAQAIYFIPSENELYKSIYYKGEGLQAGYYAYPNRSLVYPIHLNDIGNTPNSFGYNEANCRNSFGYGTRSEAPYLTPVGLFSKAVSAYGACDTGGNVDQWTTQPDETDASAYVIRGGSWASCYTYDWLYAYNDLQKESRRTVPATTASNTLGFRIASSLSAAALAHATSQAPAVTQWTAAEIGGGLAVIGLGGYGASKLKKCYDARTPSLDKQSMDQLFADGTDQDKALSETERRLNEHIGAFLVAKEAPGSVTPNNTPIDGSRARSATVALQEQTPSFRALKDFLDSAHEAVTLQLRKEEASKAGGVQITSPLESYSYGSQNSLEEHKAPTPLQEAGRVLSAHLTLLNSGEDATKEALEATVGEGTKSHLRDTIEQLTWKKPVEVATTARTYFQIAKDALTWKKAPETVTTAVSTGDPSSSSSDSITEVSIIPATPPRTWAEALKGCWPSSSKAGEPATATVVTGDAVSSGDDAAVTAVSAGTTPRTYLQAAKDALTWGKAPEALVSTGDALSSSGAIAEEAMILPPPATQATIWEKMKSCFPSWNKAPETATVAGDATTEEGLPNPSAVVIPLAGDVVSGSGDDAAVTAVSAGTTPSRTYVQAFKDAFTWSKAPDTAAPAADAVPEGVTKALSLVPPAEVGGASSSEAVQAGNAKEVIPASKSPVVSENQSAAPASSPASSPTTSEQPPLTQSPVTAVVAPTDGYSSAEEQK